MQEPLIGGQDKFLQQVSRYPLSLYKAGMRRGLVRNSGSLAKKEVVVRQLRFLGGPGNGNGMAEQSTSPPESSEPEIDDGDIPF